MKNDEPILYLNRYECSECGMKWVEESPCKDQKCLGCKTKTTPYESEKSPIARIQNYLKTGGAACPYCGSSNIGEDFFNYELVETVVREDRHCNDCGKEWTDCYTLSSMIESDGNVIDRVD